MPGEMALTAGKTAIISNPLATAGGLLFCAARVHPDRSAGGLQ